MKKNGSTPSKTNLEQILYSGAFAYTSPPQRVMHSDNIDQVGSNNDDVPGVNETTPFNSKFTILKFNSANQTFKNTSATKLGSKRKLKVNNVFKNLQEQN